MSTKPYNLQSYVLASAVVKELENQLKYYKELKENNGNKR